ncbi:Adhesion G-Protein Coupled Receptor D2 [Manis pentadactyla]|nr:Adhesion G-Protein Coupled Receptor D2 [Manis pentadactyla]
MASEWAKASKVACVAVTAAVHLLFLVAFSWMLVEGLLLRSKVVTVSLHPGPGMMLHYATGWGAIHLPGLYCLQWGGPKHPAEDD